MNRKHLFGRIPAGNPLANALMLVVGMLAVAAAVVLGFFAFVVLSGIVLVLVAIVGIRLWWFNRKLGRMQTQDAAEPGSRSTAKRVIEGEYTVVSNRDRRDSTD